jgi:hypothetical protein
MIGLGCTTNNSKYYEERKCSRQCALSCELTVLAATGIDIIAVSIIITVTVNESNGCFSYATCRLSPIRDNGHVVMT